jgi:hypothetical protein
MHTFDGSDLLGLDGRVLRADTVPLKICTPYAATSRSGTQVDFVNGQP